MTIQLEPKELGKVRVHVSLGPDGLNIHLATETTGTREVIQASLPQLKAAFQSQGVRVDRFDVAVSSGFSNPAPPQHNAQQQAWSGARSAGYYPWEEDADAGGSESSEVRTQSSLVDYRI